jgi:DNA-binding NarL/FixJ family response regulator
MIRVLVADDEVLVRSGFRMILESRGDIEVVGEASDGEEAVQRVRECTPDVILMDIRMPGMSGLDATRAILAGESAPRVLILTTFDLDEYVYEAMRAGASGFLLKTAEADQLVAAVRGAASGDVLLAPEITRRLIERFVKRPHIETQSASKLGVLTDREQAVLRLIGQGLSNREIADELFVSEATVKTHVNRILSKLSLRDRVQAVVLAYESGLVQPGVREGP